MVLLLTKGTPSNHLVIFWQAFYVVHKGTFLLNKKVRLRRLLVGYQVSIILSQSTKLRLYFFKREHRTSSFLNCCFCCCCCCFCCCCSPFFRHLFQTDTTAVIDIHLFLMMNLQPETDSHGNLPFEGPIDSIIISNTITYGKNFLYLQFGSLDQQFGSLDQQFSSVQQQNLAAQFRKKIQQLSSAAQFSSSVQQLNSAAQFSSSVQQLNSANQFSSSVQQLSSATKFSSSFQQLISFYLQLSS